MWVRRVVSDFALSIFFGNFDVRNDVLKRYAVSRGLFRALGKESATYGFAQVVLGY